MSHKSILIVGGGPVGLALALKLSSQGKRVTVIDQGIDKHSDGRILALSYASYQILHNLNAWPLGDDAATQINTVQISHTGLGISQIKAKFLNLPELGFTIKYADLCDCLFEQLKSQPNIELLIGNVSKVADGDGYSYVEYVVNDVTYVLTCDLLVMAEGGKLINNLAKKINYEYQQTALIFHIKTREKHNNTAHERFAGVGPLVLLPYKNHYVVVWSLPTNTAEQFNDNHEIMLEKLNYEFTSRLGGAKLISKPVSFPLKLVQVKKRAYKRMVVIGNSAQVVHPVSAQGLNLGLRDMLLLSDLLARTDVINDINLSKYHELREADASAVIGFTHFLATKLDAKGELLKHLRGVGLIGLSNLPLLQNYIARSLIFGV